MIRISEAGAPLIGKNVRIDLGTFVISRYRAQRLFYHECIRMLEVEPDIQFSFAIRVFRHMFPDELTNAGFRCCYPWVL